MKKKVCMILVLLNIFYICVHCETVSPYELILGEDGLDIISDDDNQFTREQMVFIIFNLVNAYEPETQEALIWSRFEQDALDIVHFEDWNFPVDKWPTLNALYQAGVIKGYTENEFRPNSICTYEQAIIFIIRSLSQEPFAQARGGYPTGYIEAAKELELINDAEANYSKPISRTELVELLFRSLTTNTLTRDNSYEGIAYINAPCILERYHHKKMVNGLAHLSNGKLVVEDVICTGEIFNNPNFSTGEIICVYEYNKENAQNQVIIAVEI